MASAAPAIRLVERETPEVAEIAVLASVLRDPDTIAVVSDTLTPADFSDPDRSRIFAAMLSCFENKRPPDLVTLPSIDHEIDTLLLASLASSSDGSPYYAVHYAELVAAESRRRRRAELIS